ncbi:MAG: hypothetical protein NZ604_06305 [Flavobacteriales bacterium]|nr:hypothetical protein [Flavobacteriales bacterium]
MKKFKVLILSFSLLSIQFMNAQSKESNKFYASTELNIGNYLGWELDVNFVTKKQNTLKIGFLNLLRGSDDDEALLYYDLYQSYQICFGKIYELNPKETVRANLSVGLGSTFVDARRSVSLIINPKIEFPFTRFFGLTFSPMLQLNKHSSYYGIGIGCVIGALRD